MFYALLALILACTVGLGILLATNVVWPRIKHHFKKAAIGAEQLLLQNADMANVFFSTEFLSNKYSKYSKTGLFSVIKFMEMLKGEFPNLSVLTESCQIGANNRPSSCSTVIKLDDKTPIIIQFNWEKWSRVDQRQREIMKFSNTAYNLADYDDDGRISAAMSIEINFLPEDESATFAMERVNALVEDCAVESIHYATSKRKIRMYRITPGESGYEPVPYYLDVPRQPAEYLDVAYEPVEIEYSGMKVKLDMSRAIQTMTSTLHSGENIQIYGLTGSGKSKLLEQICSELTTGNSNTVCISLTPTVLTELGTAAAQASLIRNIKRIQIEEGTRIVFLIDEAEPLLAASNDGIHTVNQSFLLQLMAGSLQTELNCSTLLCYNADPKNLNQKAFRRGRTSMLIEVKQLTAVRARKLVTYLQMNLIERSHDSAAFEKYLAERNVLPGGEVYAVPGEISLADVYATFIDRDRRALLIDLIREQAGLPPLRPKVTAKKGGPKSDNSKLIASLTSEDQIADMGEELAEEPTAATPPVVRPQGKKNGKHRNRNRGKKK